MIKLWDHCNLKNKATATEELFLRFNDFRNIIVSIPPNLILLSNTIKLCFRNTAPSEKMGKIAQCPQSLSSQLSLRMTNTWLESHVIITRRYLLINWVLYRKKEKSDKDQSTLQISSQWEPVVLKSTQMT